MKTVITAAALLTCFLFTTSSSCDKQKGSDCKDVACTMMFAAVSVKVTDSSGGAVMLDEVYTLRDGSNDKIKFTQSYSEGSYVVLDDSYQQKIVNSSATFYFVGIKGGKEVVKETFVIGADCCHVNKKQGTETVIVK